MADIVKINKNIQYQTNCVVYGLLAGEVKSLEFINKNFASHIIDAYLKDGTFELFQSKELKQEPTLEKQEEVAPQEPETQEPTFEIVYKTTQIIQDKEGNEIEVGVQFTAKELKDKGFTKKKIEALLQEEKLMEVKIIIVK